MAPSGLYGLGLLGVDGRSLFTYRRTLRGLFAPEADKEEQSASHSW